MVNCIILAGKAKNMLLGKHSKAAIIINGKPMISYVIDAIKSSGIVNEIVIVGDIKHLNQLKLEDINKIISDKGEIIDNVIAGINCFKNDHRVLIVTCDIPLLTGEAVKDFVEKALNTKADICYPIIEKKISEEKYPDAKRTYAKLKDGIFTGGNLLLVNPNIIDRCIDKARQMIEFRKKPVKMSKVLGIRFLIKFLTGKLTIKSVENRVGSILDIYPKAIISDYPEIGNDVDKPEDIEMARKYLSNISNKIS